MGGKVYVYDRSALSALMIQSIKEQAGESFDCDPSEIEVFDCQFTKKAKENRIIARDLNHKGQDWKGSGKRKKVMK